MNLAKNLEEISSVLDNWDQIREDILKISRKIVRDCSVAIKSIHRKEAHNYNQKVEDIKYNLAVLKESIIKNPNNFSKYLRTPEQEYTEAVCFYSIVHNQKIPSYIELNVDPLNFLLGLADVIGEIRRYTLDNIRNSKLDDLNRLLESMDEIYTFLFSLDYPSGLTKDLRHKTDVARSIIEKTRGDVSLSVQMDNLKKCIINNLK